MEFKLTEDDVKKLNSKKGLMALLNREPYNPQRALRYVDYEKRLLRLQVELIKNANMGHTK